MDLFISLLIALLGLSNQDATQIRERYSGMGEEAVKVQIQKLQEIQSKAAYSEIVNWPLY